MDSTDYSGALQAYLNNQGLTVSAAPQLQSQMTPFNGAVQSLLQGFQSNASQGPQQGVTGRSSPQNAFNSSYYQGQGWSGQPGGHVGQGHGQTGTQVQAPQTGGHTTGTPNTGGAENASPHGGGSYSGSASPTSTHSSFQTSGDGSMGFGYNAATGQWTPNTSNDSAVTAYNMNHALNPAAYNPNAYHQQGIPQGASAGGGSAPSHGTAPQTGQQHPAAKSTPKQKGPGQGVYTGGLGGGTGSGFNDGGNVMGWSSGLNNSYAGGSDPGNLGVGSGYAGGSDPGNLY